jgi:hypothetical protein
MIKKIWMVLVVVSGLLLSSVDTVDAKDIWVKGYYRNGTYVKGHYRTIKGTIKSKKHSYVTTEKYDTTEKQEELSFNNIRIGLTPEEAAYYAAQWQEQWRAEQRAAVAAEQLRKEEEKKNGSCPAAAR